MECADGSLVVNKNKLMATGQYFKDCLEDSSESVLDLSQAPPIKITKALLGRALEFTDLTQGFTPVLQKPLRSKQTMYQVTSPALANFADSFERHQDDYETLAHMLLVANFLNNQALIDVLSAKIAIVIAHMSKE